MDETATRRLVAPLVRDGTIAADARVEAARTRRQRAVAKSKEVIETGGDEVMR